MKKFQLALIFYIIIFIYWVLVRILKVQKKYKNTSTKYTPGNQLQIMLQKLNEIFKIWLC